MDSMNRRAFIATTAFGACGALIAGCQNSARPAGDVSEDDSTRDPIAAEASQKGTLVIGTASDFPQDGAYGKFVQTDRVIVVRKAGTISAVSAICPHKAKNITPVNNGAGLACPIHGSRFDLDGKVQKGPAEDDLTHYAIVNTGGKLTVDKGQKLKAGSSGATVKV